MRALEGWQTWYANTARKLGSNRMPSGARQYSILHTVKRALHRMEVITVVAGEKTSKAENALGHKIVTGSRGSQWLLLHQAASLALSLTFIIADPSLKKIWEVEGVIL